MNNYNKTQSFYQRRIKFSYCSSCNPLGQVDYCICPERQLNGSWKPMNLKPQREGKKIGEILERFGKNFDTEIKVYKGYNIDLINKIKAFLHKELSSLIREERKSIIKEIDELENRMG